MHLGLFVQVLSWLIVAGRLLQTGLLPLEEAEEEVAKGRNHKCALGSICNLQKCTLRAIFRGRRGSRLVRSTRR